MIPLFVEMGTSAARSVAYLADETSIKTISTAKTMLATSEKSACCG
ncbi:MAG: hypothetical protein LAO09_13595 [Acidobacteriia bacterium]|nr:hypothetical protein [Terriglobia bacterium]